MKVINEDPQITITQNNLLYLLLSVFMYAMLLFTLNIVFLRMLPSNTELIFYLVILFFVFTFLLHRHSLIQTFTINKKSESITLFSNYIYTTDEKIYTLRDFKSIILEKKYGFRNSIAYYCYVLEFKGDTKNLKMTIPKMFYTKEDQVVELARTLSSLTKIPFVPKSS